MKTVARRSLLLPLIAALEACTPPTRPVSAPGPAPLPPPIAAAPAPTPAPTPTQAVMVAPTATPTPVPPAASAGTARPSPKAPAPPSAAPPPSTPGSVVGSLELLERGGRKVPAADAVLWVPGLSGGSTRAARLSQRNKQFDPHVAVVGKGGSVSFPNTDRIFHNVFSRTPGADFDLGLYKGGSSKDRAFPRPGVVRVFCNIHPEMAGYVIVLDQPDPVFAVTDATGRARLSGLPPGSHRVRIWHEKGGEQEVTVDVAAGREASFGAVLDGSRWRKEPHKDKWGEDYTKKQRY